MKRITINALVDIGCYNAHLIAHLPAFPVYGLHSGGITGEKYCRGFKLGVQQSCNF
jgi:hypothetical protein